ncbi:ArsC family reductase [Shewanella sp. WXL01]|uniref:ArsC family reductase n=1 Tax=Shewanella maritima TaxID=2520507 RepID=A0A411PD01_9GAMM|nr:MULTISPECIES: ArsC family reductase [Shewanella]NKF50570.1 ArsC family reductase [Shewanella sp. WXL01]QBF81435.1 ArsC family reductase [Shewanella maritima]
MILYGIKNCDTVKKARKWLEQNEHAFEFHDFRQDGLTEQQVENWAKLIGWETLFNKRSTSYRALADDVKASLNEASAIKLMTEQPTLIKRPVLERDNQIINGFKADSYQAWLNQ